MRGQTLFLNLADIDLGIRGRKSYDKVEELAESIKRVGRLINPITVIEAPADEAQKKELMLDPTKPYLLKTGGRRLQAHKLLEREQVEARVWPEDMTTSEFRYIELEENLQRENLTWQEEVGMKDELYKLTKEIMGVASVGSVAKTLGESQGNLSKDLKIVNAMKYLPELVKANTKADALKIINKAEDKAVQAELARRAQAAVGKEGSDKRKRGLLEAYIIGDALELIKKIPDASMDFIELDPPYGIDYEDLHEGREDRNLNVLDFKEWTPEEYKEFLAKVAKDCFRVMRDKTWGICWHSVWKIHETQEALKEAGLDVCMAPIIWHKAGQGRNRTPSSRFTIDYEVCTYFRKGVAQLNKQGPSSVFTYQTDKSSRHPTQKPVGLLCSIFECFTAPNSRILIPFLGSGNSLIAASKNNCLAFGFDLSTAYKDGYTLAVEEMFLTGQQASKAEDIFK